MIDLAPIALFVYNRPNHTMQTIESLSSNILANESDIYIFSDNAKNKDEEYNINKVRSLIKNIKGFKSLTIIEREFNYGLAKSIIDGVTEVINKYGKIIVLEDDVVTSPYFLKFMNDALNIYKNKEQIWGVSGRQYPISSVNLPDAFFLDHISCTGWGTWDYKWIYYNKNPDIYLQKISSKKDIYKFNHYGSSNIYSQLNLNKNGKINTWAIFWEAEIFINNGLFLFPSKSLINNIGFDKSGVHCNETLITDCGDLYNNIINIDNQNIPLKINKIALKRIRDFRFKYFPIKKYMFKKYKRKFINLLKKILKYNIFTK